MDERTARILKIAGAIAAGIVAYKVIFQKTRVSTATKQVLTEPVKSVESVLKTTKTGLKHFVKGSQEAKDHMASLRARAKGKPRKKKNTKAQAGRKGGEQTAKLGAHKGHTSKKGLAQDQTKLSNEVHEEHYQTTKNEVQA